MIAVAAALALALRLLPAGGAPKHAEYAARWDPSAGGPATSAEVLSRLGLAASAAGTACEIRYYDLPPPEGAPKGAAVILRRRACDDGTVEIRLKYRTAHPLDAWECPPGLGSASSEVDVGLGAEAPSRVDAYACTLSADAPPASLRASAKPCVSRMTRVTARTGGGSGHLKVEDWTLPGGARRLEVSQKGRDDVDALAAFQAVVERLREAGARFLDESKTELGSRCPDGAAR